MKTIKSGLIRNHFILCTSAVLIGSVGVQAAEPSIPTGTLSASPTIVQTGTKPTLAWNISYPAAVKDVVSIDTNGTVTPKESLRMDVRVLGAQISSSGGTNWSKVQAEVKSEGSSSFSKFFDAKHSAIVADKVYYTGTVSSNKAITFRGRCANTTSDSPSSSQWQSYYSTSVSGNNVRVLVNGDTPPNYVPAFNNQTTIKSAVSNYLKNGKINIGPMDVIILYELWGTDTTKSYFDMQDLVLLVKFTKI